MEPIYVAIVSSVAAGFLLTKVFPFILRIIKERTDAIAPETQPRFQLLGDEDKVGACTARAPCEIVEINLHSAMAQRLIPAFGCGPFLVGWVLLIFAMGEFPLTVRVTAGCGLVFVVALLALVLLTINQLSSVLEHSRFLYKFEKSVTLWDDGYKRVSITDDSRFEVAKSVLYASVELIDGNDRYKIVTIPRQLAALCCLKYDLSEIVADLNRVIVGGRPVIQNDE